MPVKKRKIIRRAWTKGDVKEMKALARSKVGVQQIAVKLKRTPGATAAMATKLGVSLSTRA